MKNLNIVFNMAAACTNKHEAVEAAYKLHLKTLSPLPLFPVLLLEKERKAFRSDNCIIGRCGAEVVACALLEDVSALRPDFTGLSEKFGKEAQEKMTQVSRTHFDAVRPLYEVGTICVDPGFRNLGVARDLYHFAANQAQGNVFAIINSPNVPSRKAAEAAGYHMIPGSDHVVRFGLKAGRAYPDPAGDHRAHPQIFRPVLR